jgi:hypothetical protein
MKAASFTIFPDELRGKAARERALAAQLKGFTTDNPVMKKVIELQIQRREGNASVLEQAAANPTEENLEQALRVLHRDVE